MGISEFKTHCIRLLKDAKRSKEAFIVTRRGEPLVRIEPLPGAGSSRRLGALRHLTVIRGDLVQTDFDEEWESSS